MEIFMISSIKEMNRRNEKERMFDYIKYSIYMMNQSLTEEELNIKTNLELEQNLIYWAKAKEKDENKTEEELFSEMYEEELLPYREFYNGKCLG